MGESCAHRGGGLLREKTVNAESGLEAGAARKPYGSQENEARRLEEHEGSTKKWLKNWAFPSD